MLNHLGFCPQDMQIDEHRRPRFDDAFPESTAASRFCGSARPVESTLWFQANTPCRRRNLRTLTCSR